ncbi:MULTISPECIES: hypothetical protein [unclassified Agarivorans]|uniref:hypothetical protein n=1 Tax=unclassified Agarivorans TaxID=2636026 RepID=UPI003D7DD6C0
MSEITLLSKISLICFMAGCFGVFFWLGLVAYLKSKWLIYLEDELDDGVRFYSLNMFFSGQGVLQYATVFLSSFHAKRYGMLEKRDHVPKHIRNLFVFAFCWFILSFALMVAGGVIMEIYDI